MKKNTYQKSQLLFNMGIRYGIKQLNNGTEIFANMTYRRAIYKSDYRWQIMIFQRMEQLQVNT